MLQPLRRLLGGLDRRLLGGLGFNPTCSTQHGFHREAAEAPICSSCCGAIMESMHARRQRPGDLGRATENGYVRALQ